MYEINNIIIIRLYLTIVSSCSSCFVQGSFTHNRTLDVRPGIFSNALELHYDYNVKRMMRLWDDKIRLLYFASRSIYSVLQMLGCSFMVFDS